MFVIPNKKIKYSYLFKLFLIIIMMVPFGMTCLYVLPAADDFSNACASRELIERYSSYMVAAIVRTNDFYWSTSGYYSASFLNLFFSPLLRYGILGIRVFCFLTIILFYLSLYNFVKVTVGNVMGITRKDSILTLYILLLICFTNIYLNVEANFWYCVSAGYILIIIFMFLGLSCFVSAIFIPKRRYMLLAMLFGFLGSGGSLNVAALNCFLYLLLAIYVWTIKDNRRISCICFSSALFGGIVNLISPGNYLRHDQVAAGYNIGSALFDSAKLVVSRLYVLFTTSILPWIFALLLLYFLIVPNKVSVPEKLHPVIIAVSQICALIVFAFPVYLGYGNYFPDRCVFVQDTALYIFLFILAAYTASWMKKRWKNINFNSEFLIKACMVLSVPFCIWHGGRNLENIYPSFYLAKQIVDGNHAAFVSYWNGILDEIEHSDKQNVVVERELFNSSTCLISPGIGEDPTYWVNIYVAKYYGKDTVRLVYTEESK